jgi:hypothetical protein
VLAQVFKGDELATIEAIAADLKQANRSLTAVKLPGRSNTAQDTIAALNRSGDNVSTVLRNIASAAALGGGLATGHGKVGAALAVAGRIYGKAADTRLDIGQELVRQAMLEPSVARVLLSKAPPKAEPPVGLVVMLRRALLRSLGETAITSGLDAQKPQERRPAAPAPFSPFNAASGSLASLGALTGGQ